MIHEATLKLQKNNDLYEVKIFDTPEEATPFGGSCFHVGVVKGNDILDGYVGVSHSDEIPVNVVINNENWYIAKNETVDVKIVHSANLGIMFKCGNRTVKVNRYTGDRTITCNMGEEYSLSSYFVSPSYDAGPFNIPVTGIITNKITTVTSSAILKRFAVHLNSIENAKMKAIYKGKEYTTDFYADIYSEVTFIVDVPPEKNEYTYSVNGVEYKSKSCTVIVESDITANVISAEYKEYQITLKQEGSIEYIKMTANGKVVQSGDYVPSGSLLTVEAEPVDKTHPLYISFS